MALALRRALHMSQVARTYRDRHLRGGRSLPTSTKRGPSAATRLLVATQTFLLLASLIVVLPTAAASRNAPPSAPPPSVEPSAQPTPAPTADPTAAPTPAPTADPTAQPRNPTAAPSASATTAPTQGVAPTASAKTIAPTKPGRTAPGHVSALAAAGSEIGWWKFDGNLTDSSTNANNGTGVGSPTFATGKVGQAVSLNGTSQWVSVADANSLDFTTGMTLAAWIRPTATGNRPRTSSRRRPRPARSSMAMSCPCPAPARSSSD